MISRWNVQYNAAVSTQRAVTLDDHQVSLVPRQGDDVKLIIAQHQQLSLFCTATRFQLSNGISDCRTNAPVGPSYSLHLAGAPDRGGAKFIAEWTGGQRTAP